MSSSASSNIPRHATHRYHTGLMAVGGAISMVCLFGIFADSATQGTSSAFGYYSYLILGITLIALGHNGRRAGAGVQLLNTSFDLIARGKLVDAEKFLDELDKTNPRPLIQCTAAVQRGLIAMRRGDAKTGLTHLDRAVATKPGFLQRDVVRVQTTQAQGIRAFLRAVSGDREGARADAKALRDSPDVLPQALARAALAEAICIEKEGDRDALRKHLADNHDLLFDVTDRRERAIVRAFQRMLETTATSVYRKGAKLDLHGDDPPLVDWVAQLVPSAAPFVETVPVKNAKNELPAPVASDKAQLSVTNDRKNAAKSAKNGLSPWKRVLLIYAAIVGMSFAIFKVFGPDATPKRDEFGHVEHWDPTGMIIALIATFTAFIGGLIAWRIHQFRKGRQETRTLFRALNIFACGKLDEAHELLGPLTGSRYPFVRAHAHLALAYIAERRTDLAKALEHCDQGIASLSRYVVRISASDILLPDLIAERAFVLAAMDRHDEAETELASLPPVYPFRSRALLRVRLVSLVRKGDLDAAAKLASETDLDLPLTARDELFADGLRVAVKPESRSAEELKRIRRELRAIRPWLATVAPAALDAIERATADEVALGETASTDAAAEAEAHAEAEAAREEANLHRAARTL